MERKSFDIDRVSVFCLRAIFSAMFEQPFAINFRNFSLTEIVWIIMKQLTRPICYWYQHHGLWFVWSEVRFVYFLLIKSMTPDVEFTVQCFCMRRVDGTCDIRKYDLEAMHVAWPIGRCPIHCMTMSHEAAFVVVSTPKILRPQSIPFIRNIVLLSKFNFAYLIITDARTYLRCNDVCVFRHRHRLTHTSTTLSGTV